MLKNDEVNPERSFGILLPGAVTRRPDKREVKEGRQREAGFVRRSPTMR